MTGQGESAHTSGTGHNLSGRFLDYWNNSGLAIFGYPISEEHAEKNPLDGLNAQQNQYLVQVLRATP